MFTTVTVTDTRRNHPGSPTFPLYNEHHLDHCSVGWTAVCPSLPHVKYHPDPIRTGAIVEGAITCNICVKERNFRYDGPFHDAYFNTYYDVPICPWCIADGSVAAKYDGWFQLDYPDYLNGTHVGSKAATGELCRNTLGHKSIQPAYWLVHCDDYCAFIDYVGWQKIEDLVPQIRDDIKRMVGSDTMVTVTLDTYRDELSRLGNGAYWGYLFRCLTCGQPRFYADNT
jgi:uncharacterized protein